MSLVLLLEVLLACLLLIMVAEIKRLEMWSIQVEALMSERPLSGLGLMEEVVSGGTRGFTHNSPRYGVRPMRRRA